MDVLRAIISPRVGLACRDLGMSRDMMIGKLAIIEAVAALRPDGMFGWEPEEIEVCADWQDRPGALVSVLEEHGLIDCDAETYTYTLDFVEQFASVGAS